MNLAIWTVETNTLRRLWCIVEKKEDLKCHILLLEISAVCKQSFIGKIFPLTTPPQHRWLATFKDEAQTVLFKDPVRTAL